MADQATLGQRLQAVRKRRGLTQAELARASGVSVSLIRQVEQGVRDDTRLETLRKLALALRVPTTALITRPDADPAAGDDVALWAPVRRALEGRGAGQEPAEAPTLAGLTEALGAAMPLLLASRYGEVAGILPALLRDADVLVDQAADGEQFEARRLRSQLRQVTSWLMTHTWQFDAADHAIQLAIDDASDPLTAMAAIDWQCWGLLRQGRLEETRDLATRAADNIEPRISKATREELTAWGLLLLRASTAAVRDNRPGEADDALNLARMAAVGVRNDYVPPGDPWHVFGPKMVAMITAENAIVQDRPDVTLRISSRLDGAQFPLARNWHRHRLDVACAHAAKGEYPESVAVLHQVQREAPQWLVTQRYARDIVRTVIDKRRTLTTEMRELASAVRLPL